MFIVDDPTPCKTENTIDWFSNKEDSKATLRAKAGCSRCPFRRPCLRETLDAEEQRGKVDPFTAGGKTFRDRRKILKSRAARRVA